jgi:ABC-type transport system involved in multi-copper enzyme maturation permease subunit
MITAPRFAPYEANPLFQRESRGRWRDGRSFLLLGLYALAVAGVVVLFYDISGAANHSWTTLPNNKIGREMFLALSAVQLGAILLIVPALASTTIAYERERGLLESLQLSELSAWRIVTGKLLGVLAFALLFWMCGIPGLAICFLLGGVSPDDFLSVLALHAVSMLCSAAIGLWLSSRARRPLSALRNTFLIVALWIGLTWPEPTQSWTLPALSWFIWWQVTALGVPNDWLVPLRDGAQAAPMANPFSVLSHLAEIGLPAGAPFAPLPFFPLHLGLQAAVALLCLWRATVNVRRTFAHPLWLERKRRLAIAAPRTKNEKRRRELLDTPLIYLLRFKNPILQREVRSRLRLRAFSRPITWLLRVGALLSLILCAWTLLWVWAEPLTRVGTWQNCITLLLGATMLYSPLAGALTLVRERENGTWENLRLSLLIPRQVLWGKIAAPLILLGGAVLLFAPLWIPCVQWTTIGGAAAHYGNGVPLDAALATLALIFATAFCYTSWGAWISARSRNTATAVGWTLGTILLFTFLADGVISGLMPFFGYIEYTDHWSLLWKPWGEWQMLNDTLGYGEQPWRARGMMVAPYGGAPIGSVIFDDEIIGYIPYPFHTFAAAFCLCALGNIFFAFTVQRLRRDW